MSIQALMQAIAQMEGFGISGSIAQRFNNPGNLRYSPLQSGSEVTKSGKFATFDSPDSGWLALEKYIEDKANKGVTLREFVYAYAPPNENDTSGYLNFLSGKLGIGVDEEISKLYGDTSYNIGGNSGYVPNYLWDSEVSSGGLGLEGVLVGVGVVGLLAFVMSR